MIWRSILLASTLLLTGACQDMGPARTNWSLPTGGATIYSVCANSPTDTTTASCSLSVNTGDTILVWTDNNQLSSLSDSAGNTLTLIGSAVSYYQAWYIVNATSGTHTITANFASGQTWQVIQVADITGAATSSPIDVYALTDTASSSGVGDWSAGPITTTVAGDAVIGFGLASSSTATNDDIAGAVYQPFDAVSGITYSPYGYTYATAYSSQGYVNSATVGSYTFVGTTQATCYSSTCPAVFAEVVAVKP